MLLTKQGLRYVKFFVAIRRYKNCPYWKITKVTLKMQASMHWQQQRNFSSVKMCNVVFISKTCFPHHNSQPFDRGVWWQGNKIALDSYRHFGIAGWSHLQESSSPRRLLPFGSAWRLDHLAVWKHVTSYQATLHTMPKERKPPHISESVAEGCYLFMCFWHHLDLWTKLSPWWS